MSFTVTVLGSSSALPTSTRNLSAHVVKVHERFFLIDCGEGTQMQMRKFKINFSKVNHIFISHLHGDHYFGLFGLISTFALLGQKCPLEIYSPPDLENLLMYQLNYLYPKGLPFPINFHLLDSSKSEIIFDDDKLSITTIPLLHRMPTCGFLFHEKPKLRNIRKECIEQYSLSIRDIVKIKQGFDLEIDDETIVPNHLLTIAPPPPKSYAYCSDTGYNEKMVPIIENVDLLYHEATFCNEEIDLATEKLHSTARQAAVIASLAKPKKLLIGHFSARHKTTDLLLKEARDVFSETFVVEDGLTFEVG